MDGCTGRWRRLPAESLSIAPCQRGEDNQAKKRNRAACVISSRHGGGLMAFLIERLLVLGIHAVIIRMFLRMTGGVHTPCGGIMIPTARLQCFLAINGTCLRLAVVRLSRARHVLGNLAWPLQWTGRFTVWGQTFPALVFSRACVTATDKVCDRQCHRHR